MINFINLFIPEKLHAICIQNEPCNVIILHFINVQNVSISNIIPIVFALVKSHEKIEYHDFHGVQLNHKRLHLNFAKYVDFFETLQVYLMQDAEIM